MINKKTGALWLLLFIGIVLYAVWLQSTIIINHDNFRLLHVTQQLLAGGHYYYNFFEVSPPMILYLYIPPVLISKVLHFDLYTIFRLYTFTLAIFILVFCNALLKSTTEFKKTSTRYALISALLFIFVILFPVSFGQREHITLMLIIPYLILASMKNRINIYAIIMVGVLAGIGFIIKPQFLIPLLFVEFYLIIKNKKLLTCFRTETITLALVCIIYFVSLFIFTPDYLFKMLPFISAIYYHTYPFSFAHLFWFSPCIFFILSYFCFFVLYNKIRQKTLASIIAIASFGFIIVYFLQFNPWQYHFLPAYGLITLLDFILIFDLALQNNFSHKPSFLTTAFFAGLLALIIYSPLNTMYANINKNSLSSNLQKAKKITTLIKKYGGPNRSAYLFSPYMTDRLFLTRYCHVNLSSRFVMILYFIEGLNNALSSAHNLKTKQAINSKGNTFINLIVNDLQQHSPNLIFYRYNVNMHHKKVISNREPFHISYFLQNKKFSSLFKHYKPIAQMDNFVIFQKHT